MAGRLILDKAGRVVLPKRSRNELQLAPGDDSEQDTVKPLARRRRFESGAG